MEGCTGSRISRAHFTLRPADNQHDWRSAPATQGDNRQVKGFGFRGTRYLNWFSLGRQ
jgi:hypothetical protein